MKRKTFYEWRGEKTEAFNIVDIDTCDKSFEQVFFGDLKDYRNPINEHYGNFWEIQLNKRVFDLDTGDIIDEDEFYVELTHGTAFQFIDRRNVPKKYLTQLERYNKKEMEAA